MLQAPFACVQCGEPANELYRNFNAGIIKINHCNGCGEVVDKYIEYDPVIIYLDAVLLKIPAFRHILINTVHKSVWKFTLILLLCEAFVQLLLERSAKFPSAGPVKPDYVFYSALEWNLYWYYMVAALEMTVFIAAVLMVVFISHQLKNIAVSSSDLRRIGKSLVWSHFGRLVMIPAMLWGQSYSAVYLALSRLYVFAANVQALRVCKPNPSLRTSVFIVGVGYLSQLLCVTCLHFLHSYVYH